MQNNPTSSLIIVTYNWPAALDLCLKSVLAQTQLPDEVIIADDGSTGETKKLIDGYAAAFPVPLKHVWQPDEGFQAGKIRNKGSAVATGEYILQIDGDLILHPGFVQDHVKAAQKGYFVGGSRVLLDKKLTGEYIQQGRIQVSLTDKGIKNHLNGLHFPQLGRWLSGILKTSNAYSIRSCNIAYWKEDLVKVNGYDEIYTGWGREDTDLVIRLFNAGCKRKFFKFQGIVYHLWHKEADRNKLTTNDIFLKEAIDQKKIRCEKGISQYL